MRIIITSQAAGGKDFFRNFLNQHLPVDISYTTRPKRPGEISGFTYNYISTEEFEAMEKQDAFFESVFFNGYYYGTSRNSWENKKVFILTPSGVAQIPKLERKECIVVFIDIEESIRKSRLKKRNDAVDNIDRRLKADREDFKNFSDFDISIKNPSFSPVVLFDLIKKLNYAYRFDY